MFSHEPHAIDPDEVFARPAAPAPPAQLAPVHSRFNPGWGVLCLMMPLLGVAIGFSGGYSLCRASERTAAIRAGVGHYKVDTKTGASSFVYARPRARAKTTPASYATEPTAR